MDEAKQLQQQLQQQQQALQENGVAQLHGDGNGCAAASCAVRGATASSSALQLWRRSSS